METRLHLFPIVLASATLSAQPVLDFNNTGTLPGESYIYHASPWQSPGSAGIDQTWDFSSFTTDSLINISFVDPATTPDAALFTTATIAADNGGGAYAYSSFGAYGGFFLGLSLPPEAPIVYSDAMTQASYPSTYLTEWTDDYAATYTVGGFDVTRTGTITAQADAYGTLVLPYGDLTDVLRVTYTDDYEDVSIITLSSHREYTHYLQAGTHYPIAHIFSFTTTVLGNSNTITGAQWLDNSSLGLAAARTERVALAAYPNPAMDLLTVEVGDARNGTLELVDAQGRSVLRRTLGTNPIERLPVGQLEPGLYLVRLQHQGALRTQHVVVL